MVVVPGQVAMASCGGVGEKEGRGSGKTAGLGIFKSTERGRRTRVRLRHLVIAYVVDEVVDSNSFVEGHRPGYIAGPGTSKRSRWRGRCTRVPLKETTCSDVADEVVDGVFLGKGRRAGRIKRETRYRGQKRCVGGTVLDGRQSQFLVHRNTRRTGW